MEKGYKNLSAVLYGKSDLRMEDALIPEPGYGEVQVKLLNCGVCGTDVHLWHDFGIGMFALSNPVILGHESSSVVSKVGPGVTHLKVGDRVATEPGVSCLACEKCKSGRYNLCQDMQCIIPKYCGSLTRYAIHGANFCFKLTDDISDEEGAFIEPFAVTVYACERAGIKMGDTVLICGSGPIGLLSLLTVKARGATTVIVTDVISEKLETAKKLGASYTVNVKGKSPTEAAKVIEDTLGGLVDVTLECSGATAGVSTGIYATTRGGNVTMVGIGDKIMEVPLGIAALNEVDIRGVLRYCHGSFPTAVSLVANKMVDLKPLITHRYKLEQTPEALKMAASGQAIKVMIRCADN